MSFRNWPSWLKGLSVSGIILVCAYVLFTLKQIIKFNGVCPFFHERSFEICWVFPLIFAWYALIPVIVIGTIIGAIVGNISKGKGTKEVKGLKIGFWVGLILGILMYTAFVMDGKWWVPAAWV